jgi:hypothetical protein
MDIATILAVISTIIGAISANYLSDVASKMFRVRADEAKVALQDAKQQVKEQPNQIKPIWEYAQAKIDEYVANNLVQLGLIFRISIIVMSVGFILIAGGIGLFVYLLFNPLQSQVGQSVSISAIQMPGVLATIAGVITEFIGATFLFMYQSAIQQSMSYVKTLERINAVGMAVEITNKLPDDQKEMRDKTISEIAKLILLARVNDKDDESEKKEK